MAAVANYGAECDPPREEMVELTKRTTTTWSRDLPIEIVTDILTRLPSKSLLRLRCVCKSWLHLISGRNFIQLHRNLNKNGHVLVRYELFDSHLRRSRIFSLHCDKTFVVEQERIGLELPSSSLSLSSSSSSSSRSKFEYVGCSNGLVCLSCSVEVFSIICLWNPSIRKWKVLPRGLLSTNFYFDRTSVVVAFGFVPQMNDYRVLKIVQGAVNDVKVEIYSLSTNSWKLVENVVPFRMICYDNKVSRTVNGVFHFVAYDDDSKEVIILSVDMAKETFNRINFWGGFGQWNGLGQLNTICEAQPVMIGESLLLCHKFAPEREGTVDIWEKTKELGAVECWTKKLTIDHPVSYLGFLKNGELVWTYIGQVSSYDPRHSEIKDLQLGGVQFGGGVPGRLLLFTEYMESLVLLDQGD